MTNLDVEKVVQPQTWHGQGRTTNTTDNPPKMVFSWSPPRAIVAEPPPMNFAVNPPSSLAPNLHDGGIPHRDQESNFLKFLDISPSTSSGFDRPGSLHLQKHGRLSPEGSRDQYQNGSYFSASGNREHSGSYPYNSLPSSLERSVSPNRSNSPKHFDNFNVSQSSLLRCSTGPLKYPVSGISSPPQRHGTDSTSSSLSTSTPSSTISISPPHSAFTPPMGLHPTCFNPAALGGLTSGLWGLSTPNGAPVGSRGPVGPLSGSQGPSNMLGGVLQGLAGAGTNGPSADLAVPRNCSDLMRSMAAKYNNRLEVFNSALKGFSRSFGTFQDESSTSGVCSISGLNQSRGLNPAESSVTSSNLIISRSHQVPFGRQTLPIYSVPTTTPAVAELSRRSSSVQQFPPQLFPSTVFPSSARKSPNSDQAGAGMTSAQMLLNMVRNVSNLKQHQQRQSLHQPSSPQNQLQSQTQHLAERRVPQNLDYQNPIGQYIKAGTPSLKRPADFVISPLDLSSALSQQIVRMKRPRLESEQEDIDVEGDPVKSENSRPSTPNFGSLFSGSFSPPQDFEQKDNDEEDDSVFTSTSSSLESMVTVTTSPSSTTSTVSSSSSYADSSCRGVHPSSWTVDDVYNFVKSIDICSEYAERFRDQRIDGYGLSLLTEAHLTASSCLDMKLGPALKLRALLTAREAMGPTRGLHETSPCNHCCDGSATSKHDDRCDGGGPADVGSNGGGGACNIGSGSRRGNEAKSLTNVANGGYYDVTSTPSGKCASDIECGNLTNGVGSPRPYYCSRESNSPLTSNNSIENNSCETSATTFSKKVFARDGDSKNNTDCRKDENIYFQTNTR